MTDDAARERTTQRERLLADMRRASEAVDLADGPTEYQIRLASLAMITRQYLRALDEAAVRSHRSAPKKPLKMLLLPALAELRHAYWNLTHTGIGVHRPMSVEQQREFADGLIAPQIRRLEELLGALSQAQIQKEQD